MTQRQLSAATGYSHAIVSQWENDLIKPKNLLAVAQALRTSMEWLLTGIGSPDDRNATVSIDGNVSTVEPVPIGTTRIPVIDYVQAGCWTEACGHTLADGSIETILTDLELGSRAFALRVKGDSMAPDIIEGDVVVVDPDVSPQPGDIVVAKNGSHEATIKQYRPRGYNAEGKEWFELVPRNEVYAPMRSDVCSITIIGVMVEHRRYRRRG
ncbi:hypothetical protein GCM10023095_04100 [Pseudaeromonas paramecii]|uniref:HTH cro/C1-type domain-containing protein n=2 Tax=Pseudaeromonas paramecii TaxID=2138166 RepID=A0ABP8PYN5_9GAMM